MIIIIIIISIIVIIIIIIIIIISIIIMTIIMFIIIIIITIYIYIYVYTYISCVYVYGGTAHAARRCTSRAAAEVRTRGCTCGVMRERVRIVRVRKNTPSLEALNSYT